MCAGCWSGGQIIPAAAVAWRYLQVNKFRPGSRFARRGPDAKASREFWDEDDQRKYQLAVEAAGDTRSVTLSSGGVRQDGPLGDGAYPYPVDVDWHADDPSPAMHGSAAASAP